MWIFSKHETSIGHSPRLKRIQSDWCTLLACLRSFQNAWLSTRIWELYIWWSFCPWAANRVSQQFGHNKFWWMRSQTFRRNGHWTTRQDLTPSEMIVESRKPKWLWSKRRPDTNLFDLSFFNFLGHSHAHRVSRGLHWFGHNKGTNLAHTHTLVYMVYSISKCSRNVQKKCLTKTWLEKVVFHSNEPQWGTSAKAWLLIFTLLNHASICHSSLGPIATIRSFNTSCSTAAAIIFNHFQSSIYCPSPWLDRHNVPFVVVPSERVPWRLPLPLLCQQSARRAPPAKCHSVFGRFFCLRRNSNETNERNVWKCIEMACWLRSSTISEVGCFSSWVTSGAQGPQPISKTCCAFCWEIARRNPAIRSWSVVRMYLNMSIVRVGQDGQVWQPLMKQQFNNDIVEFLSCRKSEEYEVLVWADSHGTGWRIG